MSETAFVYCLVDAEGAPMYVGQTQYGASERAYGHWVCRNTAAMSRNNPGLAAWLRTLPASPRFEVLDEVSVSGRLDAERYYVECFLWAGVRLLNRQLVPEELRVPVVRSETPRRTPSMILWRGVMMPVNEWLRLLGVKSNTFYARLSRGWPLRKALTHRVDTDVLDGIGPDISDPVMTRN